MKGSYFVKHLIFCKCCKCLFHIGNQPKKSATLFKNVIHLCRNPKLKEIFDNKANQPENKQWFSLRLIFLNTHFNIMHYCLNSLHFEMNNIN